MDAGGGQFLHSLVGQHYLFDRVVAARPTPWAFDDGDVLGLRDG